jgi:hypothetical protein
MRLRFGIALLVALFVAVSGASAGVVPLIDGSFENPSCGAVGSGTSCAPVAGSWVVSGSANQWVPSTGAYNSIPDGVQVGWANTGGSLTQTLTTALALNTTYTLTLDLGARSSDAFTFGGAVELLAGSTVLGSASGATPTLGNWDLWTLVYDSGSSNAAAGQDLVIKLMSTTNQTGFDAVQLSSAADVTGVPEPTMFVLVGVGLLGLVSRRRFAK